jgi:hypothetical protein
VRSGVVRAGGPASFTSPAFSAKVIPVNWQRANVQAAATYLRERISSGAADAKTKAVYEGLLDVLDPTRRAARMQREMASSAQAAATVTPARERRGTPERRARSDRRKADQGSPTGRERRSGHDRRTGRDRRNS